jgi:CheY-like chemotaxis protein
MASILEGMMADATDDPRLDTVIAGYRIEERIGRGGMGVVYRAEHLNLQRRAAIKIIAPDLAESEGFRERFTREARIAAALQHPNIVTVYDAGEVDGLLYLAMQFIQGEDLAAILRADRRLRPYRAIDVCRQVASALDAAHAMGLIHRDVKPANVLIEGRNAFLTDFGLTKRLEGTHAQLTRAGDVVGTIHYVAPEQIEGRKVSARSDVYSLGCLLYHCLAGQVPFALETDVAVIYAHLSEEPPKLSALRPELPEGLDAVMAKALDKSPDRRFPSCGDMISAARAVIDAAGPLSETIPPRATGLGPLSAPTTSEVRDAAEAARRPRVLLGGLDDHTRAVARVALGDRVDVLEAPAGATADRAREQRPDLVILDWAGSGAAGIAELRDDALTRDAKVLLLVDYGEGTRREVVAAGADDRLAAPFSPLQLQVKLRRLLGAEVIGG